MGNDYLCRSKISDMSKHTLKEWLIAVRPWSFPASAMPVVVTLAYLFWTGASVDWGNGLWALINIVVFHAAGNTWSDYFDYRRGVDAADTFGVRTLTSGMFRPGEIMRLSLGLLAVALLGGLGLLWRTGLPLLYVGLGGLACAVLYPPLKYRAWGDVVIFFAYALLPILGTTYVCTSMWLVDALWLALPVGLITVAILHANNTRDIRTDRRARISTLAMRVGVSFSARLYAFEVLFPFLWMAFCMVYGVLPLHNLLVWIAFAPALGNARTALSLLRSADSDIHNLDERTAKLQLMFSLLLSLSFVLATFFPITL